MAKMNKMIIGLIVLVAGIITLFVLPAWGKWLTDYPNTVAAGAASLPAASQATLAALNLVFVPIIQKVGDWLKLAGYGGGVLMALIGIFVMLGGMMKSEK